MDNEEFCPETMPKQGMPSTALHPVVNPYHPATNWTIVYHRIEYGKANGKPCTCEVCTEYLAGLEVLRQSGELA